MILITTVFIIIMIITISGLVLVQVRERVLLRRRRSVADADYTILDYTILYYTITYHTIQYHTMLYHAIPCYTMLYYNVVGNLLYLLYSSFELKLDKRGRRRANPEPGVYRSNPLEAREKTVSRLAGWASVCNPCTDARWIS